MEENALVIDREQKINELVHNLITVADGKDIIGDGKKLVRHAEFAKITHDFADGIYIRKMNIKAGSVVMGAFWKYEHFWFLMTGSITIADKYGVEEYIAPCYVKSLPGAQRVVHANEDSIFMNIHKNPTNTTDVDELELYTCSLNLKEYNEYIKNKK
tara:strand:- start:5217 stop:5687 length:471 start_codon:yes stop_codon:yes gene_type:complete